MGFEVKKLRGKIDIIYSKKFTGIFLLILGICLSIVFYINWIDLSDTNVIVAIPISVIFGFYYILNKQILTLDLNESKLYYNKEKLGNLDSIEYFQILKRETDLLKAIFMKRNDEPYQIIMVNNSDEYNEIFPPVSLKEGQKFLEIISKQGFLIKKELTSREKLESEPEDVSDFNEEEVNI